LIGLHKSPKALYGVNYERLVELKKKYDPGNIFKRFVDLLSGE
jgi:FAD/FMN-containing dehydrogenase